MSGIDVGDVGDMGRLGRGFAVIPTRHCGVGIRFTLG